MNITVNSKEKCVQCNATYRALDARKASYSVTDVLADAEALARIKALGHLQAPVVIVEDSATGEIIAHWSGFDPEKIEEYANKQQELALV